MKEDKESLCETAHALRETRLLLREKKKVLFCLFVCFRIFNFYVYLYVSGLCAPCACRRPWEPEEGVRALGT